MAEGSTLPQTFVSSSNVVRVTATSNAATVAVTPSSSTNPDSLFPNLIPNPLKKYASYTYLFSIACLTPAQLNDPTSYRKEGGSLTYIMLSEGGRDNNKRVGNYYGKTEFFINNVEFMQITNSSGIEPVANFKFDIYEPYSMGLFLQTLQVASLKAGWGNYTTDARYVLKLEYVGWTAEGNSAKIPAATRYLPFSFTEISFTYTDSGTIYKVKGMPAGQEAFNNVNNSLKNTVAPFGKTVEEALGGEDPIEGSLSKLLDDIFIELKEKGVIGQTDNFVIKCVDGEFNDGNHESLPRWAAMADSAFAFSENTGSRPFASDATRVSQQDRDAASSRDAVNSGDKKQKSFTFTVGTADESSGLRTITACVREIVLNSEFCAKAFEKVENGFINWFTIRAVVKPKPELGPDAKRGGQLGKTFYYYVMPYRVNAAMVKNPAVPAEGLDPTLVRKKYDFLYTGQNDDIISWNITLDNTYYQTIFTGVPEYASGSNPSAANASTPVTVIRQDSSGVSGAVTTSATSSAPANLDPSAVPAPNSGAAADSPEVLVARQMQKNLIDTYDQLTADLEIYGDPYYSSDEGYGGYFPAKQGDGINSDGAAAYNSQEVRIYIRFKTPNDAPRRGQATYPFPNSGASDSPFSGFFRITKSYAIFKDGMYTNKLRLMRDKGQVSDAINATRTDASLAPGAGLPKKQGEDPQGDTVPEGPTASGGN